MNDDQQPVTPTEPASHQQPSGRVFDVMRPGKTQAHPSGRPTIVGHVPQVQDTMVGGTPGRFAANPADEDRPLLDGSRHVHLEPGSPSPESEPGPTAEPAAVSDGTPQPESTPATEPAAPAPAPETPAQPAEPEKPAEPATQPWSLPQENQTPGPGLSPEMIAQAEKEVEPNTHPMLKQEGVTVSHHKRSKAGPIILTFVVLLVLAAVAGNFLLDAQVVKTNMNIPHTHLLKK